MKRKKKKNYNVCPSLQRIIDRRYAWMLKQLPNMQIIIPESPG